MVVAASERAGNVPDSLLPLGEGLGKSGIANGRDSQALYATLSERERESKIEFQISNLRFEIICNLKFEIRDLSRDFEKEQSCQN